MNPFQLSFPERLREWRDLRELLKNQNLEQQCVRVDSWWQRAPLVNHYLHPNDSANWPDPWTLLSDNEYCTVARGLGIMYTLTLIGVDNHQLCAATDEYGDDIIIVTCDKYAMNWHPNTVLNTPLSKFTIKRTIDITHLLKKIR